MLGYVLTMNLYGEVEVWFHAFLISAPDGKWWASHPGCFTPRRRAPDTYCIRSWLSPIARLDAVKRREKSLACIRNQILVPWSSISQPVHYTDWGIYTSKMISCVLAQLWNIMTIVMVLWTVQYHCRIQNPIIHEALGSYTYQPLFSVGWLVLALLFLRSFVSVTYDIVNTYKEK